MLIQACVGVHSSLTVTGGDSTACLGFLKLWTCMPASGVVNPHLNFQSTSFNPEVGGAMKVTVALRSFNEMEAMADTQLKTCVNIA